MGKFVFKVSDDDKLYGKLAAEVCHQLEAASRKTADDWSRTDIVDWAATITDTIFTILEDRD